MFPLRFGGRFLCLDLICCMCMMPFAICDLFLVYLTVALWTKLIFKKSLNHDKHMDFLVAYIESEFDFFLKK